MKTWESVNFFQFEVKYLGHIIMDDDIVVDRTKIEAIMDWPAPTSVPGVHSFIGLASYYHQLVKDF